MILTKIKLTQNLVVVALGIDLKEIDSPHPVSRQQFNERDTPYPFRFYMAKGQRLTDNGHERARAEIRR